MAKLSTYLSGLMLGLVVTFAVAASDKTEEARPVGEPKSYEVTKTGTFNGTKVEYKALANETYLKNEDGDPTASILPSRPGPIRIGLRSCSL